MFKKVTIATAFSAALLFGGAMQTVDASASFDGSQSQENVSQHNDSSESGNRYIYRGTFQDFLAHFFHNNRGNWYTNEKQESTNHNDSDQTAKDEQTKAPQETEDNNSNNQSSETEETEDNNSNNQSSNTEEQKNTSDEGQLNEFEKEVVSLTNDEREKNGLEPLKADAELSVVARDKSKDMRSNGYFAHNSPTYGSPFDMMESYGITYRTAGENIARGQRSPSEVVNAWMNSEGHRANILNPKFTHIGVGFIEQGNYWTQEFTGN